MLPTNISGVYLWMTVSRHLKLSSLFGHNDNHPTLLGFCLGSEIAVLVYWGLLTAGKPALLYRMILSIVQS